jgi:hypothetical protein
MFYEYADVMGRSQSVSWSKGLRAELGPTPSELCRMADGLDLGDNPDEEEGAVAVGRYLTAASNSTPELEDAVAAILAESGEPLHISGIRQRLIGNGVRIPGAGTDANIIVRLRKDTDRFTPTARGTYALASWGLPSLDAGSARRKKSRSKR